MCAYSPQPTAVMFKREEHAHRASNSGKQSSGSARSRSAGHVFAVLPSEEDATSLADSRSKLKN